MKQDVYSQQFQYQPTAALILEDGKEKHAKEIFKTECLNDVRKNIDFNGLGSSNIHYENKILFH